MAARAYLALRRPADAITHLKRVTTVQRDNISAHNLLAQAQMRLGQFHQAVDTLAAVLKLDERNSSSYYNLAVCQMHHGGVTQVVDTLNRAVSMFGAPFVASWAGSADLAPLRTNDYFKSWEARLGSNPPPTPATNGPPAQPAPAA
jgi:tetratricopeptide (TPR) repeat protein